MTALDSAVLAAVERRDFAPFGACLLQRARLESGLAEIAGRPAIIAWLHTLLEAFDEPLWQSAQLAQRKDVLVLEGQIHGQLRAIPGFGAFTMPISPAILHVQLRARLERGLAVELAAITDWRDNLVGAGFAIDAAVARVGGASPCHPPLGELASGLGQLGIVPPSADAPPGACWVAAFNSRNLAGPQALRRQFSSLLAQMPDARLLLEHEIPVCNKRLLLLRLQGHVAGRRVSLPASISLDCAASPTGNALLRFDSLALAASGHRPFFPD